MTALDKLKATRKRTSIILMMVGFNILNEDYKLTFLTYLSIFDCITYMSINAYDIKLFWGDLIRVCFCLVTWSFGYQCSARIIVFLTKGHQIRELYDQVHAFFRKIERDIKMEKLVNRFAGYIDIQTKAMTLMFYSCAVLTVIYPGLIYLFSKEVILPFGFVIPGLSDTEQPGYALNYCHHVMQVAMTAAGLTASQCINVMFLIGACLMIESLIARLNNLGKELETKRINEDVYQDVDLTEIIEFHQEILQFVNSLESTFSFMFMVDVISIPFQIIITLMVCTTTFWIPGYVIMLCVSVMLLLDCGYGLFIEIKFDDLCTAVYDLPWHLMSIKDRKTVHFMLARTQKPPLLTFGKMAYMNMATFVQVYKSVYSYFMVLKSFEA